MNIYKLRKILSLLRSNNSLGVCEGVVSVANDLDNISAFDVVEDDAFARDLNRKNSAYRLWKFCRLAND